MQLLRAPQIWALEISGCGRYAANSAIKGRMVATYGRSYQSRNDGSTVHRTWFSAAAILTLPTLQVLAISVVERIKCRA